MKMRMRNAETGHNITNPWRRQFFPYFSRNTPGNRYDMPGNIILKVNKMVYMFLGDNHCMSRTNLAQIKKGDAQFIFMHDKCPHFLLHNPTKNTVYHVALFYLTQRLQQEKRGWTVATPYLTRNITSRSAPAPQCP